MASPANSGTTLGVTPCFHQSKSAPNIPAMFCAPTTKASRLWASLHSSAPLAMRPCCKGRNMATITFKGKFKDVYSVDDTLAYSYFTIPKLDRRHCDMAAFRIHAKYGAYANSDMFSSMLARIVATLFPSGRIRTNEAMPDNVTVTHGFLSTITIEV